MTPVLVILAGLVVAGAVAAVAAMTPRLAVLGLLVALLGSGFVADPYPGTAGLLARLVGATLGVYLVWIALRRSPVALPAASVGWAGAIAIAIAAFAAGWLGTGTLGAALDAGSGSGPGLGTAGAALVAGSPVPRAALGAALALGVLAIPQVVLARDTLRLGMGLLLLIAAGTLATNALVGRPDNIVALGMAILMAIAGAAVAAVIELSIRRGGDLVIRDSLRPDAAIRHRAADDAHRPPA